MWPSLWSRSTSRRGLAGVLVLAGIAASAEPMAREINPGVLGPNAVPPIANEGAWIDGDLTFRLGWSGQLSTPNGGGLDGSMLVPFKVSIGLFDRVQFWADGSPFELWQYSEQTRDAWAPRRSKGITRADVRLAAKVLLFSESGARPAVAVRTVLKTATGEDLYTRRFLDAPAYQFDALTAWHWLVGTTRLEAWASVGFLAWQQGAVGQNDALAYAGTLVARWPFVSVRLEVRGFAGWQRADKPLTVELGGELQLTPTCSVLLHSSRTFFDPPSVELGAAVRLRFARD